MKRWEGYAYMLEPVTPGASGGRQRRHRYSSVVAVQAETRAEARQLIRAKLAGKAAGRAVSARPV